MLVFFSAKKGKGQILLQPGVDKEDGVAPFPNLFRVKICKIGKSVRRHHHPCLQLWVNGFSLRQQLLAELSIFVQISLVSLPSVEHLISASINHNHPAISYSGQK